jgi:PhnB protein
MTGPAPYVLFPGTAHEALTFYGEVFGCAVQLHTFGEFNRADGPADAIAHGYLAEGPVALSGADVSGDERPLRCEGLMLALLALPLPRLCAPGLPVSAKVAGS